MNKNLVIVRGGGDIATGTIHKLVKCGFKVVILEIEKPTVIRRTVSFAQAIYDNVTVIEGVKAIKVNTFKEIYNVLEYGNVPVLVDESGSYIHDLQPEVVVDATLAKRNLGTFKGFAPIVIGLGPGFEVGIDVHAIIETNRGHNLGRVILKGSAEANTGIPGNIAGFGKERIVRAPGDGKVKSVKDIGDLVKKGEIIAYIDEKPVKAPLEGVIRGLIYDGVEVSENFKIGDIDPRKVVQHCFTISDKSRAVAGGVLEAILFLQTQNIPR